MPNFQDAFTYFELVKNTINTINPIFLNGSVYKTIGQNTFVLGKGQTLGIVAQVTAHDSGLYRFEVHPQQLELEQTIDGTTYTGLMPMITLNRLLYDNVANVVANFANDEFGKRLALNDYLDVTNSGCSFICTNSFFYGYIGYSSLTSLDMVNRILFAPNEDSVIGQEAFFFPTISFVKSFESVPYLFNVNFQLKTKNIKPIESGQSTLRPPLLDFYLDYQCEYHAVGGV